MTQIVLCKFCKLPDRLVLKKYRNSVGGKLFWIVCTGCGTQGDRGYSVAEAKENWNKLHRE